MAGTASSHKPLFDSKIYKLESLFVINEWLIATIAK